ncbi:MAG: hypothetical protein HYV95_00940 [Opitutae bacterium]|nr:hypothetical protein [Opitutae bacterium]
MNLRLIAPALGALAALLLSGCDFDFPLTAKPTRPVDERLLGNWTCQEDKDQKPEQMNVRKLDDSTYIVSYNGDLYRAQHSDLDGFALLSVQDLNPVPGRYVYVQYQLSTEGTRLALRTVNAKLVLAAAKDQAGVEQFVRQNADNPKLLGDEGIFNKKPDRP